MTFLTIFCTLQLQMTTQVVAGQDQAIKKSSGLRHTARLISLVRTLKEQGKYEEALKLCEQSSDFNRPDRFHQLAMLAAEVGDLPKAVRYATEAKSYQMKSQREKTSTDIWLANRLSFIFALQKSPSNVLDHIQAIPKEPLIETKAHFVLELSREGLSRLTTIAFEQLKLSYPADEPTISHLNEFLRVGRENREKARREAKEAKSHVIPPVR